jgi:hypothetical protein
MRGASLMSAKERERLKIFASVRRGKLQQKEAAALCDLDSRYLRRLYQRYCEQGDCGLVHQGRGRVARLFLQTLLGYPALVGLPFKWDAKGLFCRRRGFGVSLRP